ncbi:hypothetical protein BGZ76_010148 [Entomortierella beljakovae]|nr:hypothetical protein BGZ76_010148 [Entomortierella beljakovae]
MANEMIIPTGSLASQDILTGKDTSMSDTVATENTAARVETCLNQEGSDLLDAIDDKTGVSSDHDVVSTFWILNTKLPSSKRFAYLPIPGYKDNYCLISELHLMDAALRRDSNIDRDVRGRLVGLFGPAMDAYKMTQSHELSQKLFFYGKEN